MAPATSTRSSDSLSAAQARRIVLDAQGLLEPRPTGRLDRRHLRRVTDRFGLVQLDSVNVLARAHLLPFFTRLGAVDPTAIDRMAYDDRELFEYWGHEASLCRADLHPLLRFRMAQRNRRDAIAPTEENDYLPAAILDEVEAFVHEVGPIGSADAADALGEERTRSGPWWDWGQTKRALEVLFQRGRLGALRRGNFERVYCAPALAVPTEVLDRPTPTRAESIVALSSLAVRAHGVATAADVADYWRIKVAEARSALAELRASGDVVEVTVEGWTHPAYVTAGTSMPRRRCDGRLVNPFDPAMWHRERVERVHDFAYKIEIYVPEAERRFGYYCLPFLLGDTYVGRVDLKADRAGSALLVQSAWHEPDLGVRGTDDADVASRLRSELRLLADWLGLDDVIVRDRGNLAPALLASP